MHTRTSSTSAPDRSVAHPSVTLAKLRVDVATRHREVLDLLVLQRRHDRYFGWLATSHPPTRRLARFVREDSRHLGAALLALRLKLNRAGATSFKPLIAEYEAIVAALGDHASQSDRLWAALRGPDAAN